MKTKICSTVCFIVLIIFCSIPSYSQSGKTVTYRVSLITALKDINIINDNENIRFVGKNKLTVNLLRSQKYEDIYSILNIEKTNAYKLEKLISKGRRTISFSVLGFISSVLAYSLTEEENTYNSPIDVLPEGPTNNNWEVLYYGAAGALVGGLIGAKIETEKWQEIQLNSIKNRKFLFDNKYNIARLSLKIKF